MPAVTFAQNDDDIFFLKSSVILIWWIVFRKLSTSILFLPILISEHKPEVKPEYKLKALETYLLLEVLAAGCFGYRPLVSDEFHE